MVSYVVSFEHYVDLQLIVHHAETITEEIKESP